jgi:putative ABC transport system permease protein
MILFLAILVALFVTLPTVNLINVNISRILERASEIGVRKAFGAPTRTLVGQFVVENVVLTLGGAAIGLVLSAVVLRALNQSGFIAHSSFGVNLRVFAYAIVIAVGFGLVSGVYPAWRMARLHPVDALKGGPSR